MTPDAMLNALRSWWQKYARTLTDTADYEPWWPREEILDRFATLVHSLASQETHWNWDIHRCLRYEVPPHGLTHERVRAALSAWWQTYRRALVASAGNVHSVSREPLFAALVGRLVELTNEAMPLLPEEQQATAPRPQVAGAPLTFVPRQFISVPPMLEEAFGYTGHQHLVSFCSTPARRLRCYDGWGGKSHGGSWRVWQAFHAHAYVRDRIPGYASRLLGLEATDPIVYCLVLHRERRLLEVQEIVKADHEIDQGNYSFATAPLPVDPAFVALSEDTRLAVLQQWLDERARSLQAHPYVFVCSSEVHRRWQQEAPATDLPLSERAWRVPPPSTDEPGRPVTGVETVEPARQRGRARRTTPDGKCGQP